MEDSDETSSQASCAQSAVMDNRSNESTSAKVVNDNLSEIPPDNVERQLSKATKENSIDSVAAPEAFSLSEISLREKLEEDVKLIDSATLTLLSEHIEKIAVWSSPLNTLEAKEKSFDDVTQLQIESPKPLSSNLETIQGNESWSLKGSGPSTALQDTVPISTSRSSKSSDSRSEMLADATDFVYSDTPSLRISFQDTFGFPYILPPPSRSSNQQNISTRRVQLRRWRCAKCLKCTDVVNEEDDAYYISEAPPTYSSIYTNPGRIFNRRIPPLLTSNNSSFLAPVPPPSYAQAQGICVTRYSTNQRVSISPSVAVWSPRPTAAICPRCAAFVITITVVRRSSFVHLLALILFCCGCWPCCVVPYCMNSCKNIDHYCPVCHTYLGTYTPW